MTGPIVRAWETPRNEGTMSWEVGHHTTVWRGSCVVSRYAVGRIDWVDDGDLGVYDDAGDLRVLIPACAVAVEFGPVASGGGE